MTTSPERMCVACRTRHPKAALHRYVLGDSVDGSRGFIADPEKVLPGRGYYICNNEKCREKFRRFKGFGKKS